jgi:uncharacterized damage-inducible protein DinB
MITPAYVQTMAQYNRWQNANIYGAAGQLSDADRKLPRGAFFGSIHGTLNHILWADEIWMSRLAAMPTPKAKSIRDSVAQHESWEEMWEARQWFDRVIIGWAVRITEAGLAGDLTWFSGAAGREVTRPKGLLVAHMFNHQTHHRGQLHCLLTQCGQAPGVTDLPFAC